MTRLTDSIDHARLLSLVSARPDFAPPWLTRPHATLLTLGPPRPRRMRRSGRQCRRRARPVGGNRRGDRRQDRWRSAVRRGVDQERDGIGGRGRRAVPATLKDSLMARLDRLGEAREVAQIAAVIGRQFALRAAGGGCLRGRRRARVALAKLVAAGIVFPEARGLERSFSFKHALVRDAAYESLLLARRREWHERIARALEQSFPESAANEPEVLAYHFGEAGSLAPACDYRMRAGDRAVGRSAYRKRSRISRQVSDWPMRCRTQLTRRAASLIFCCSSARR